MLSWQNFFFFLNFKLLSCFHFLLLSGQVGPTFLQVEKLRPHIFLQLVGKLHACVWGPLILERVSLFFYMFHILYWSFIEEQTSPRKCAEQSNPPQNISQFRLTSFTEEPELSTHIKYVESIRRKNTGLMLTVWYPRVAKAPELMLTSCDIIITREYIFKNVYS